MERAFIYGDSLLKATMPDADMRYHFHLPEVMAQYPSDRLEVVNRAKMGATVTKGLALVEHDVQRGMDARWALVAYGGNDSDFDWEAVAAAPEEDHLPHTTLPEFTEKLRRAVTALKSAGVQPVLMTLPPIDGQRYFRFISQRRTAAACCAGWEMWDAFTATRSCTPTRWRRWPLPRACPLSTCGGSSCPSAICPALSLPTASI